MYQLAMPWGIAPMPPPRQPYRKPSLRVVEPSRSLRVRTIIALLESRTGLTLRELADITDAPGGQPEIQSVIETLCRCPALYEDVREGTGADEYTLGIEHLAEWISYLITERRKYI